MCQLICWLTTIFIFQLMVVIQTGIHGHHVLDIVALDFKHVLEVVVILNLLIMALDVPEPVKKLKIVNTVRPAQVCLLIQYILSMRLTEQCTGCPPPHPPTTFCGILRSEFALSIFIFYDFHLHIWSKWNWNRQNWNRHAQISFTENFMIFEHSGQGRILVEIVVEMEKKFRGGAAV
jgi:hypothetical protein